MANLVRVTMVIHLILDYTRTPLVHPVPIDMACPHHTPILLTIRLRPEIRWTSRIASQRSKNIFGDLPRH
jgi:hypothetical protein